MYYGKIEAERDKQRRATDPEYLERRRAKCRRHYAMTKEARRVSRKKWADAHPGYAHDWHLRNEFGITTEQYNAMLAAQNGLCAICHKPPEGNKRLSVDHDHTTGKVRSLIHNHPCNLIVGYLEKFPKEFADAIKYVGQVTGSGAGVRA